MNSENEKYLSKSGVGNPFSGLKPYAGPLFPYIIPSESIDKNKERLSITAELGRLAERIALLNWSGIKQSENVNHELNEAFKQTLSYFPISKIKNKQLNHEELSQLYNKIPPYPNEPLGTLIDIIDKIYEHPNLANNLKAEMVTYPPNENTRYILENALVIARLTLEEPPKFFGKLYPDIEIRRDKNLKENPSELITQFDGIICDEKTTEGNFDIFSVAERKPRVKQTKWGILEIKMPFEAQRITGLHRLGKIARKDIAQLNIQLAKLILQTEKPINLPNYAMFIYLRGPETHVTHFVKINSNYIKRWGEALWNRINWPYGPTLPSDLVEKMQYVAILLCDNPNKPENTNFYYNNALKEEGYKDMGMREVKSEKVLLPMKLGSKNKPTKKEVIKRKPAKLVNPYTQAKL